MSITINNETDFGNYSPLDPIGAVLSSPPGTEAATCLALPPELSLFEPNSHEADVVLARADHERMRNAFEKHGITSYNMRQLIGEALAAQHHAVISNRESFLLEQINRLYELQKKYQLVPDFETLAFQIEQLFDIDVRSMGLDAAIMINGVLTNVLNLDGTLKQFDADQPPAGNVLFWRDPLHVTGSTVGMHKMHYPIRQQEVLLAKIGLDLLGIEYADVLQSHEIGSIEGGDILPFELRGDLYVAIGCAERTTWEAVTKWYELHEHEFRPSGGGIIPLVVKGPNSGTQDQMHLDTFMQQVAPGAVIHCGEITQNRQVSILTRHGGEIVEVNINRHRPNMTFKDWIESQANHIYEMSREEQLLYAPNVLVHGSPNKGTTVFVTRNGTPLVTEFLRWHADKVVQLGMDELTKFYGGAHCCTNEFRRR